MGNIYLELTVILCVASFLAIIFRFLKQPSILAYLITGILIGPLALINLHNLEVIRSMAEIGITLLLFSLGLELKISDLRSVGKISLVSGILQIGITGILGFLLGKILGFSDITSLYLGAALTFSSTIIIVKFLSDKKDLRSLYGKITLGILLVQDMVAIGALIILTGLGNSKIDVYSLVILVLKGIALFGWTYVLGKYLIPKIVSKIARSPEQLFLFSLAFVFGLSALVSSPVIGFSIEIGGFLAGLALANTYENYQIISRVRPLRDFFITIFFVSLGIQMVLLRDSSIIFPLALILLFVVFLKPFVVLAILGFLGHRKRTSFLSAISFAQVSEFSLIMVFTGSRLNHISNDILSTVTAVGALTFVLSTYFMVYSDKLYGIFMPVLNFFERKNAKDGRIKKEDLKDHIVLVGANRIGESVLDALTDNNEKFVVIDFDPDVIKSLKDKHIPSYFGDIIDSEIQDLAGLDKARLIISTIPDMEDNILLLKAVSKIKKKPKILVTAFDNEDAKAMYSEGADYVVLPHVAGGHHLAKIIVDEDHLELIERYRAKDLAKELR